MPCSYFWTFAHCVMVCCMLFPMTIVMMFLKGGNTRFLTTTAHSLGVSHLVRVQQYQRKLISHQEDNLPTHSSLVSTGCLKVSKNQNYFMKTSFLTKSKKNYTRLYISKGAFKNYVCIFHCNKSLHFLATYPPLNANLICESFLNSSIA